MSTTSRSRARLAAAILAAAVILSPPGAAWAQQAVRRIEPFRPGAPLPALAAPERPPALGTAAAKRPVELAAVRVAVPGPEGRLGRLAPPGFFERAPRPVVIEVETAVPLDPTPRNSLPVIVLNGERLLETRVVPESANRLVAFLPHREGLRERNEVRVVWLGNERLTETRQPLFFTPRDIRPRTTVEDR